MLDKPTAIALLRAMAAISEEVDPRNEVSEDSSRGGLGFDNYIIEWINRA
jgi:hypothetical protein